MKGMCSSYKYTALERGPVSLRRPADDPFQFSSSFLKDGTFSQVGDTLFKNATAEILHPKTWDFKLK